MSASFVQVATQLTDWYWTLGKQRNDRFALSPGSWLDRLYQTNAVLKGVDSAMARYKPCMAVWGPSQTGKSTLLSSFVDAEADPAGRGSALHWPGGNPALFVVKDPAIDALVLNPFAFGSDASGCVSRFLSAEDSEVVNQAFPVGLQFAEPASVFHAIAMG